MREYPVTTNTDIVLELPALTVTVRAAFYIPPDVLAPRESDEGRGRETFYSGWAAQPFFKVSGRIEAGKPVPLADVVDLDGKKVQAKARSRRTGIALTDVRSSWALPSRTLGEAKIPLWNFAKGNYILRIVPPENEQTKPNDPSGPKTTIEPGVDRTYRPLNLLLGFDGENRLVSAETVHWNADTFVRDDFDITNPYTKKPARHIINHGYVTAFSASELAIDWKPDFIRTVRTLDGQKATTESGAWKRKVDMVVVHATGGAIISGALNTALGPSDGLGAPFGPHYEIDADGHNLKFAYDDAVVSHAGMSRFYDLGTKKFIGGGSSSVGIEVINKTAEGAKPQEPYGFAQIRTLKALIKALVAAHPAVERHRIVGHSDVRTDDNAIMLSDDRIACPGRQMHWPELESEGMGRLCVEKTLAAADYSGFFSLVPEDFPAKFPGKPSKDGLYLREGDSDGAEKWGGITWTTKAAKELLAAKKLTFKGIIAEAQTDLRTLGYYTDVNGKLDAKTAAAVKHYLWHTFSGDRRNLVPGGNGNNPKVWLALVAVRYLKASAERLLADIAAASAPPAGSSTGGPAQQHAQVEPEPEPEMVGDGHERLASAETAFAGGEEGGGGSEGESDGESEGESVA